MNYYQVFDCMDYFAMAFLQDAACLMCHERGGHCIFQKSLFLELLFLAYKVKFAKEHVHLSYPKIDPTIDPLKGNHFN